MSELENLGAGGNKKAFDDLTLDVLKNDGNLKKMLGEDGYPIPDEDGSVTPKDFINTGAALIDLYNEMKENPPSAQ